jgi:hypothetical protein
MQISWTKTHNKGNHLDQICTNLPYNAINLEEFKFTDHLGIKVEFVID